MAKKKNIFFFLKISLLVVIIVLVCAISLLLYRAYKEVGMIGSNTQHYNNNLLKIITEKSQKQIDQK